MRKTLCVASLLLGTLLPAHAEPQPADPLQSARWQDMQRYLLADQPVVFDARVKVTAPALAEDPLQVPVVVDARELDNVREIVVFADFNPLNPILRFRPQHGTAALIGLRAKLQQGTPVRAAAQTTDGVWHLGGTWVDTTGGGCTQPATGRQLADWQQHLNQLNARLWPQADGRLRLRLRIEHPMDTGLAAGIPAFHLQHLVVSHAHGPLAELELAEPVAQNPVFTLELPAVSGVVRIQGEDNNGNRVFGEVQP